ncbi:MAG: GLPGLI family protein [Chitinophagaceae bacterium]
MTYRKHQALPLDFYIYQTVLPRCRENEKIKLRRGRQAIRYILRYACIVLLSTNSFAQAKPAIGRVVYENTDGKSNDFLDFWFSASAYKSSRSLGVNSILINAMKNGNIKPDDSLADVRKMETRLQVLAELPPVQTYYSEIGKKETFNVVNVGGAPYAIIDSTPYVKWEILNDTQTINGLLCQKAAGTTALTRSELIAWFAPSIPTSIAPYTLRGLPGLLVEASYNTQPVSIRMLSLEYPVKEYQDVSFPRDTPIITLSELREMQAENNQY